MTSAPRSLPRERTSAVTVCARVRTRVCARVCAPGAGWCASDAYESTHTGTHARTHARTRAHTRAFRERTRKAHLSGRAALRLPCVRHAARFTACAQACAFKSECALGTVTQPDSRSLSQAAEHARLDAGVACARRGPGSHSQRGGPVRRQNVTRPRATCCRGHRTISNSSALLATQVLY